MGGQRHDPAVLPPGRRAGTNCTGGWVGRRAGLDGFGLDSPDHPVGSESLYLLRYLGPGMESVKVPANAHEPTAFRLTSCKRILSFYEGEVCTCDGPKPYLLTPWSRVLLEKLTGSAASQEIPRIFGTRRFITAFTSARHLSLSWANSIQSPQPPPTS